ncbi:winged helix-turn-helix domain-containing protein [Saccharolobus islandicus]|uniref:ArnR1-like winged helix-turn-helix domain-containing protein n=3 Tax=Saccharolobus islandicus TaxID=43080 RepID=C3MSQ1_SACI4|nr:winged helix-turn-helix domain-containing protein [Sulfolobus islandicus]ACP39194.1 conserved hypothetical protein [Sulfolobus islandicus M.14.25]ACP56387.1 conserved hypothetical protein [Sulfolobus islandicus M.16.27]
MRVERRKRGTMEIMLDILRSCDPECGVTRVIYGAGINYSVAQKYLDQLIKVGALSIKTENGKKIYGITEKGKLLRMHIEEFIKIRENLNLAREKVIELLKTSIR